MSKGKAPSEEERLERRDPRVDQVLAEAGMMRLADAREVLAVPLNVFRLLTRRGLLPKQTVQHPVNDLAVPCVRRADVEDLRERQQQRGIWAERPTKEKP